MKNLYSSKIWIEIRIKIIAEDKCCAICGTTENLEVHHKIRYKNGGSNDRENLITLCSSHHQKIHTLERFYINNHSPRDFERLFQEILKKYRVQIH